MCMRFQCSMGYPDQREREVAIMHEAQAVGRLFMALEVDDCAPAPRSGHPPQLPASPACGNVPSMPPKALVAVLASMPRGTRSTVVGIKGTLSVSTYNMFQVCEESISRLVLVCRFTTNMSEPTYSNLYRYICFTKIKHLIVWNGGSRFQ